MAPTNAYLFLGSTIASNTPFLSQISTSTPQTTSFSAVSSLAYFTFCFLIIGNANSAETSPGITNKVAPVSTFAFSSTASLSVKAFLIRLIIIDQKRAVKLIICQSWFCSALSLRNPFSLRKRVSGETTSRQPSSVSP